MVCSKPIIAVRASAVPEVATHGLLAEPDNARELANALLKLHANPAMRDDLGRAGAETVKRFDAPLIAREFGNLLNRIAESG